MGEKVDIKKILSSQYLIFSLVSHTDAQSFDSMEESKDFVIETMGDLKIPHVFGTGIDDKGNCIPYVFADVSSIAAPNGFNAWQELFLLMELLGQEIYLRGFKTQGFLMGMRFSVMASVDDIVYHGDLPEKNYFVTDKGEAFTINFKPSVK